MYFLLTSIRSLIIFTILCITPVISSAVNVKDFGARGDGVTDDSKAITTAIKEAKDGVVEFPRGSYRITRTIEVVLSGTNTLA